jgi:acyl carrier protein
MTTSDRSAYFNALTQFFREHVPAAASADLSESTVLLGTGLLDSLAVIQLMMFLGTELGIEVEDDDFAPENLGSIGQLLSFVERKKQAIA